MTVVKPTLASLAGSLRELAEADPERARRRWAVYVATAFAKDGAERTEMLDFNARLATGLRENGASRLIWGIE